MKLISSYPRSGSAKLKLLICNIFHKNSISFSHDFKTINHFVPSIDSADQLNHCADNVKFICTHANIRADIYIHRHVGDVLISEYWYKKKYYPDFNMTLEEWIEVTEYGAEWRKSIEAGRACSKSIAFHDLNSIKKLSNLLDVDTNVIQEALPMCSFDKMSSLEKKGELGGNEIPYMRKGTSGQWRSLDWKVQEALLRANEGELYYLGYWSDKDWLPFLLSNPDRE